MSEFGGTTSDAPSDEWPATEPDPSRYDGVLADDPEDGSRDIDDNDLGSDDTIG
jgi:hypothetical protein